MKNKSYVILAKKRTSVWKLLQEASLACEIKVTSTNRFVFKTFLQVAFCLIKHNWVDTHNFENLVQLVSGFGGKRNTNVPANLSKNATYKVHLYYE